MRPVAVSSLILASCAPAPASQPVSVENYLCTVAERASIASIHLEDAPPPEAILDDQLPTRFAIAIKTPSDASQLYELSELSYIGLDRDLTDYGTEFTVLHDTYTGDGREFTSADGQSFFVIYDTVHSNDDGDRAFYHAGWEYPGGEDTNLSVRWGRCKPAQ